MNGVTILNSYPGYSVWGAVLLMCSIAGAVAFGVAALACFDDSVILSGFFAGMMIVFIIGCSRIRKTETVYEVILDDGVSWNEFSEHYEVVQERGKILRVRDKDGGIKDGKSVHAE